MKDLTMFFDLYFWLGLSILSLIFIKENGEKNNKTYKIFPNFKLKTLIIRVIFWPWYLVLVFIL